MRIELPSGTPAELSLPAGTPVRGVVIGADIFGLRPLYDELGARLAAEQQWAVCTPEPFSAEPDADVDERRAIVQTLDDERQIGDLVAAAELLRQRTGVDRVAVVGFCLGGMYALKASTCGEFDKAVAFYGMIRVPDNFNGPGHRHPIDLIREGDACPTMAIIGGLDDYTPTVDVDDLEAAGATVVRYPDAQHGFVHDPSRPMHRPDDAADAWRRVHDFLR
jgi:carboxymethylenebutenolidase